MKIEVFTKTIILIALLSTAITYGLFAFVLWEANAGLWGLNTRVSAIITDLALMCLYLLSYYYDEC